MVLHRCLPWVFWCEAASKRLVKDLEVRDELRSTHLGFWQDKKQVEILWIIKAFFWLRSSILTNNYWINLRNCWENFVERLPIFGHVESGNCLWSSRCMHRREYLQLLEGALSRKWCRELKVENMKQLKFLSKASLKAWRWRNMIFDDFCLQIQCSEIYKFDTSKSVLLSNAQVGVLHLPPQCWEHVQRPPRVAWQSSCLIDLEVGIP